MFLLLDQLYKCYYILSCRTKTPLQVNLVVAYAPASAFLDELIGHAVVALGLHGFIAFSDATNLEHNMTANPRLLAGIEFAGNNEVMTT